MKIVRRNQNFKFEPIVIFCDNQSIMKIVKNLVFHAHMKHIKVYYHYIREKLENEKVELVHIPSQNHLADVMIKPLGS